MLSEALYLPLALVVRCFSHGRFDAQSQTAKSGQDDLQRSIAARIRRRDRNARPASHARVSSAGGWPGSSRRRQLALALAFVVAAALIDRSVDASQRPRITDASFLIASEGGVTFWTGNHPLARGEGDLAANPELKRAEIAFRAAYPDLTAEQLEPLYYQAAFAHIREHPGWWLTLLARKAFYTLVPIGPSYTLHSTKYLVATVLPYALLAPLAIAGFIVIGRAGHPPAALYLMAASVVLTSLIFFPQERFRLPVIDPLVIVAAAAAMAGAGRRHA